METFAIRSLDFTYPNMKKKALDNIDLCINEGEFVVICGKSGCGKSATSKNSSYTVWRKKWRDIF